MFNFFFNPLRSLKHVVFNSYGIVCLILWFELKHREKSDLWAENILPASCRYLVLLYERVNKSWMFFHECAERTLSLFCCCCYGIYNPYCIIWCKRQRAQRIVSTASANANLTQRDMRAVSVGGVVMETWCGIVIMLANVFSLMWAKKNIVIVLS